MNSARRIRQRRQAPRPRNPLVAPAARRKAGRHGKSTAAQRRAGRMALQKNLRDDVDRC